MARAEGNSGTTVFSFTISLSAPTGLASSVSYATANGSAASGSDYEARSGTLTIPAGETSATVAVPVIGDTATEADEVFDFNLSSPTNATIADGQGRGTILNDDEPALRVDDVAASEGRSGTKPFSFTVSLSAPTSNSVSVGYATVDGTARSRTDYAPLVGILTIPANQTTATITVDVHGDTKREGDETFYLNLYGPTNSSIADGQGLGRILNDD